MSLRELAGCSQRDPRDFYHGRLDDPVMFQLHYAGLQTLESD